MAGEVPWSVEGNVSLEDLRPEHSKTRRLPKAYLSTLVGSPVVSQACASICVYLCFLGDPAVPRTGDSELKM